MPEFEFEEFAALGNLGAGTLVFMQKAGQEWEGNIPTDALDPLRKWRRKMLAGNPDGEVGEYLDAEFANDEVGILDGLLDVIVVALGTAFHYYGPQVVVEAMNEIVMSNFSKVGEDMIKDSAGKVLKPPSYRAPDLQKILERHGMGHRLPFSDGTFLAMLVEEKEIDETTGLPFENS